MTRISSSDQVLLLLRERLQRLDRGKAGGASRTGVQKAPQRPVARLQALAAADAVSEEDFRRTLVLALLSEDLGENFVNDASFRTVAEDVYRIISASEEGRQLVERATRQIRG